MKAKKLLALLLTVLLIGGMLPTAFAEGEVETAVYSPEYVFNLKAIGKVSDENAVPVSDLDKVDETTGERLYNLDRNISSGEWWFESTLNIKTCNIQSGDICFYTPVRPVKGSACEDKNAVILSLTVDKAGAYVPSVVYTGNTSYGSFIDLYLISEETLTEKAEETGNVEIVKTFRNEASMTDPNAELKHIFACDLNSAAAEDRGEKTAELINLEAGKYYLYAVISDSKYESTYTSERSYGILKSIKFTNKGSVSVASDKTTLPFGDTANISATAIDGEGSNLSDAVFTYTSSDEKILKVSDTGVVTAVGNGKADIIVSTKIGDYTVSGKVEITAKFNKNPEYKFNIRSLKNPTGISNNPFSITDPAMINEDNSSIWYYYGNTHIVNKSIGSDVLLVCTEGNAKGVSYLGENALVLKVKTDVEGVYIPTIAYQKGSASGYVDMYTIPVSEVGAVNLSTFSNVEPILAKADRFASFNEWANHGSKTGFSYTGNSVYLPAGESYIFLVISKGEGDTTHAGGRYYAYIESLSLKHTTGVSITNAIDTMGIGKSLELQAKALDNDNNTLSNITYTSSAPSIVSVSGNKITALDDGKATITASVTTDEGTFTDSFDVTVSAVWNPKYAFNSNAIADESIKAEKDKTVQFPAVVREDQINQQLSTGIWTCKALLNFASGALYGSNIQARALGAGTGNNAIVLNAKIDKPGTYQTVIEYSKSTANGRTNVYLLPKSYAAKKGWDMGVLEDVMLAKADVANAGSEVVLAASVDMHNDATDPCPYTGNIVNVPENEFYIVINVTPGCTEIAGEKYFSMIGSVELNRVGSVSAASADTTLEIGETTEVSSKAYDNRDNEIAAEITYENLTPSVVSLSGNTVTALAEGEAVIKATATVDGVTVTDTVKITVSPKQVSIATDIAGIYSVKQYAVGSDVTITAPALSGKTFRYWVRGTEATGLPVSESASYTFKAVTKAYFTAVYSENAAEDAKVVEFYAENGAYIGNAVANEEGKVTLPTTPSLTGYVFSKWMTDAKTEFTADTIVDAFLTKVVATYDAAKIGDKSYGDEVKNEASSAKVWKRDGKIVSYGTEYTYYVWADSEIEAVDGEKPATPIIVLDSRGKEGNARMIEYDANGFEIVEAGILFGNGTEMSVESCMYKAASKINANHGQFTAKPFNEEYTTARGYIVYKDNGEYKVVYSH